MRLYARPGSPRLYADLIHPATGERIRVSTGETEKRAATKAALLRLQELRQEAEQSRDGRLPITINAALDAYCAVVEDKASGRSIRAIALKLTGRHPTIRDRHTIDGAQFLHQLTALDLDDLVSARRRERMSTQTIAHELKVLRSATRRAIDLGFRAVELRWKVPAVPTKTRYLSIEEYRAVFAHMSPYRPIEAIAKSGTVSEAYVPTGVRWKERMDAQDLLVVLAMTGGRWNEVAGLDWSQVDLDQQVIRLWGEKTQQERLVPIPTAAVYVFLRRRETTYGRGLVFPGKGGKRRNPSSCQPILRAMDACGLNTEDKVTRHGRATVHSLRHTFASLLLQNGAELSEVQEALGHATLDMTRRYAHLAKQKSARRLGVILSGVMPEEDQQSVPGPGTSQPAASG